MSDVIPIDRARANGLVGPIPEAPVELDVKDNGEPKKTLANVMTVLAGDVRWRDVIAYDAFAEAPIVMRQPPQRDRDRVEIAAGAAWAPQDSTRTATWLDETYGLSVPSTMVTEAMLAIAQQNTVHPVLAYLDALEWDRAVRIESFFARYCGVEASTYAAGVARMLFVSAIARVRQPGSKVDTIVVLEGDQGIGKSSMLRVLGGRWSADTPISLGDKDAFQGLRGVWIHELAELASFKGRDATRIKSFASSPVDHYRPSYEPRVRSVPRQCVFVGTTNEREYLSDSTGARRFWPVRLGRVDLRALERDRDQLWAEADVLYRAGATWWPDASLDVLGAEAQAERYAGDPWAEVVARWLEAPTVTRYDVADGGKKLITLKLADGLLTSDVLIGALGKRSGDITRADETRIGIVLRDLGFEPRQRREGGQRVRRYSPSAQHVTTASGGGS